jgi:predicted MFS family arabinose efflux permease
VTTIASDLPDEAPSISSWMTFLLALSCGVIVANIYYAQPLVGPIAAELGLSPQAAGLIVTMTQIGYGIGLFLIVPLGDLVENRRLVLSVMALGALWSVWGRSPCRSSCLTRVTLRLNRSGDG